MASGVKFLDEVYEQFLTCRLCTNHFRNPKALNCLHTFCCECLEKFYESEEQQRKPYRFLLYTRAISCPVCNCKTDIPIGGINRLPDNSFLDDLCQMVSRSLTSKMKDNRFCEICKHDRKLDNTGNGNEATSKCVDCSKFLCQICTDLHMNTKVTHLHSLIKLEIEKDVQCKIHQNEIVKYFCETCDECICIMCAFQQHKDHEVHLVTEVLEAGMISLQDILQDCQTLIDKMNKEVKTIGEFQIFVKQSEDKISETATEIVALIRQKERDLVSQIRHSKFSKYSENKEMLENNLRRLVIAFDQANAIAIGNSIETMLAKKLLKQEMFNISNNRNDFSLITIPHNRFNGCDYFDKLRENLLDEQLLDASVFHADEKSVQTEESVQCCIKIKTDLDQENAAQISDDGNEKKNTKAIQWRKPTPVIEIVQNLIPTSTVLLKVVSNQLPKKKDSFTEMSRITTVEKSTATLRVNFVDKETSTFQSKVMHKNVSTVSQATADKSTCTTNDVSNIYRTETNIKRKITVSRGTITLLQTAEKGTGTTNLDLCSRVTPPQKSHNRTVGPSMIQHGESN